MFPSGEGTKAISEEPGCGDSAAGPSRTLTEESTMPKHVDPQVASRASWWDRWFSVQHERAVSIVKTRCRGSGLRDADVLQLCLALGGLLLHAVGHERPAVLDLDISENHLTDKGGVLLMRKLLEFAVWHGGGLRLRVLKLFKNQLSDATLEHLAQLVTKQPEAIEEIHLSHNLITQHGAAALLVAIACHPFRNYPQSTSLGPCPCWVRMERNLIVDVNGLLHSAEQPPIQLSWCSAPRGKKGSNCSSYYCSAVAEGKLPQVHLFCFQEQSEGAERGQSKAQESIRFFGNLATQGWPSSAEDAALSTPKPTAAAEAVARPDKTSDEEYPKKEANLRTVILKVDEEKGAGLELEPSLYGMVVTGLEEEPGQPGMKVGDVITRIDGVLLWGIADEDVLETEFGGHFRDGVHLEVACFEAIQWRPLVQRLPKHLELNVNQHSTIMLNALREDLQILGAKCGGASLVAVEVGLLIRGNAVVQRGVVEALPDLLCFYFPSLQGAHSLPAQEWIGEVDDLCKWVEEADTVAAEATAPDAAVLETAGGAPEQQPQPRPCPDDGGQGGEQDLDEWEENMRQQCEEENEATNEFFDLDYFEVLDAPDDGPDVFEGDVIPTMPNYSYDLERPMRMLILVGLPGSGKSTLAARLEPMGWTVINQDTLGDRKACVTVARHALEKGSPVVVDRCNVSRTQRKVWLGIADEFRIGVGCLWLDFGTELCGQRVLQRFRHPTLPATASSLKVIRDFAQHLEPPAEAEGLVLWRATNDQEVETALMDCIDLHLYFNAEDTQPAASSYFSSNQKVETHHHSEDTRPDGPADSATLSRSFSRSTSWGGGQDRRSGRALYLRDLRRQIEYYFGDKNLKRDWFLQEKINSPPLEGWLEIRWLLSCPRVQYHFRASDQDIVEALSASGLLVDKAYGTYWVSRTRDFPKLVEKRPAIGEEPQWYQSLHEAKDSCVERHASGGSGSSSRSNSNSKTTLQKKPSGGVSKVAEWLMTPQDGAAPAAAPSSNTPSGVSKVAAWLMPPTETVEVPTGFPSAWLTSDPQGEKQPDDEGSHPSSSAPATTPAPTPAATTTGNPATAMTTSTPPTTTTTTPAITTATATSTPDPQRATCEVCQKSLPRASFSKAQLTKNRRHPICKDCVNRP